MPVFCMPTSMAIVKQSGAGCLNNFASKYPVTYPSHGSAKPATIIYKIIILYKKFTAKIENIFNHFLSLTVYSTFTQK